MMVPLRRFSSRARPTEAAAVLPKRSRLRRNRSFSMPVFLEMKSMILTLAWWGMM